ncbi:CASP8 and FADD-like apoptosis regulator a isoform X1 [Scleropages formosus]|uniref:CASP8 and FADD-like apoptosis regulator a isoform X1 n=1 Tax=Scleropages formosus TaxID=113540 RepID=UPI0008781895|nr:CASP8 and FADD-like apoptosis regulator isoform X1 [Scleropages formosus]
MNEEHFEMINLIMDELSQEERKRSFYLCADLNAGTCGEDLREKLESLITRGQVGPLFLLELMCRIRRFDILKKVLGTNRQEAERLIRSGSVVSDYRVLMADMSEDMGKEDLSALIFLLSGILPRGRQETATSFLDVVMELEKMDKVSSENVDLIEQCLQKIHRADLAKRVQWYQRRVKRSPYLGWISCSCCRPIIKYLPRIDDLRMTYLYQWSQSHRSVPVFKTRERATQFANTACQQSLRTKAQENIKMSVPETGRQYCQDSSETYQMQAQPRGLCVIIDCVGSDGDLLEETFRRLHFMVKQRKWLSVMDTWSFLKKMAKLNREHQEADAFVCCILSRGIGANLLATEDRGPGISLDSVRQLFATDSCPSLGGKPKLFFIQSYIISAPPLRWHRDEDLETDGPAVAVNVELVPEGADVLWSHCCTEARNLESGRHRSVYARALGAALLKGQERRMHMLDVHTEINSVIYDHNQKNREEVYSLSLRHTLRKALFLK